MVKKEDAAVKVGLGERAVAKPWDEPEEHGDCRILYPSPD